MVCIGIDRILKYLTLTDIDAIFDIFSLYLSWNQVCLFDHFNIKIRYEKFDNYKKLLSK